MNRPMCLKAGATWTPPPQIKFSGDFYAALSGLRARYSEAATQWWCSAEDREGFADAL